MNDRIIRTRSSDLVNHTRLRKWAVTIIGVGAIGSNVAYLLSKMGVGRLVLVDDDKVGQENIEPQMYYPQQVGLHKVDACEWLCNSFVSDVAIGSRIGRVDRDSLIQSDVIISGVDSIKSRKEVARALMRNEREWDHYIDGRMGGNIVELFYVTPDTIQDYWHELVGVEPLEIPCSGRAVAYNGMLIASLIARHVAALSMDQPLCMRLHIDLLAWSFGTSSLQIAPDMV